MARPRAPTQKTEEAVDRRQNNGSVKSPRYFATVLSFRADIIIRDKLKMFTEVVYLQCCFVATWLVPRETAVFSAHVLCTPYNPCISLKFYSKPLYIRRVHVFSCDLSHLQF